jgi:RNA polymerase sigma-70 factor (ECF subfamily)
VLRTHEQAFGFVGFGYLGVPIDIGFPQELHFESSILGEGDIGASNTLNHLKRAGRYEPLEEDRASVAPDPEGVLAGAELGRHVQVALMHVKADHRVVLVLRHFVDLTYEEIAATLGVPEKIVKSRLYSARQELKERLQARGVMP